MKEKHLIPEINTKDFFRVWQIEIAKQLMAKGYRCICDTNNGYVNFYFERTLEIQLEFTKLRHEKYEER